jgi:hypothetical protein
MKKEKELEKNMSQKEQERWMTYLVHKSLGVIALKHTHTHTHMYSQGKNCLEIEQY